VRPAARSAHVGPPRARRALRAAHVQLAQRRVQLRDPRGPLLGRPRAAAAVRAQLAVPRDGGDPARRRVCAGRRAARGGARRRRRRGARLQRRGFGRRGKEAADAVGRRAARRSRAKAGARARAISEREGPAELPAASLTGADC
jgi:hypothetical protein